MADFISIKANLHMSPQARSSVVNSPREKSSSSMKNLKSSSLGIASGGKVDGSTDKSSNLQLIAHGKESGLTMNLSRTCVSPDTVKTR